MNPLVNILYLVITRIVHIVKWVELQFLNLFNPWLQKKGKEIYAEIGIVVTCPNDHEPEIKIKKEKVLSKCFGKYDSLICLQVNDNSFFTKVANMGSLGFGEAYMDKVWEYTKSPDDITQATKRILDNNLMDLYYNFYNRFLESLEFHTFNLQTRKRATQAAEVHYDLGNDLYELMLDPWLQYSCGYWARADNLNQAQLDKLELIAKKLDLKPGMKVLDIGCGWGTLCKYLAENYGVECVGITISKEGAEYGQRINARLPVNIRFQDYRDIKEQFDRVVSVGAFEHFGQKNYEDFMKIVRRCLKDDGIFLLYTIGVNHKNCPSAEKWLHKYIFPNSNAPRPHDITRSTYGQFIIEDWHNFSTDYAKTLNAWRDNFIINWPKIEEKYGERFYRMWIYYLSISQGMFLSRRLQLLQIVLSKDGLQTGYRAPR